MYLHSIAFKVEILFQLILDLILHVLDTTLTWQHWNQYFQCFIVIFYLTVINFYFFFFLIPKNSDWSKKIYMQEFILKVSFLIFLFSKIMG